MAEYVELEKALAMPGLRVVLPPGIPSPWSEAIKGILHVKRLPFIRVRHERSHYAQLLQWTAQSSAPVVVCNDERPRSLWSDQLFLAERLQPTPALVPSKLDDRIMMFGLSNELCGENGFGWSRRLMLVHAAVTDGGASEEARESMRAFGATYGYSPAAAERAPATITRIATALATRLDSQRARGSRFFIGDQLSALDIYWAAFAALIEPLPQDLCAIPSELRRRFVCDDAVVRAAVGPQLLAHRDFIYQNHLELPVDL